MADQQRRPSMAAREGSIVTVILVPQNTEYRVHKAILMEHSEYFKNALTGSWKEAEERTVRLEEVDDSTFDVFVDWSYTQKLEEILESCLHRELEQAMIKCYIFGDRFQALGYKAAMLQHIIEFLDGGFPVACHETIITAFAHLPPDDIILELLVDLQCNASICQHGKYGYQDITKLPHQFLVRVVQRYSEKDTKERIDADKYQLKSKSN